MNEFEIIAYCYIGSAILIAIGFIYWAVRSVTSKTKKYE